MQVNKIGAAMGAEITGIDLSKPMDVSDVQGVLDAFHEASDVGGIRGSRVRCGWGGRGP